MKHNLKESVSLLLQGFLSEQKIPKGRVQSFVSCNDAGEAALALEFLCENLHEFEVAISSEELKKIETLGTTMGINPEVWSDIAIKD